MTIPAEDPIVMDGDLIADAVANACPRILTDAAAREIAEKTLLILSGTPGVVVTRGPDDEPWPPQRRALAPVEAVVPQAPADDPWQVDLRPHIPEQPASWDVRPFSWDGDG